VIVSTSDNAALPFQIASGTVAGRMHQLSGRNNQDALAWATTPKGLVAVVCDGCGSSPHSEVGAQLGARLVAKTLAVQLARGADPTKEDFWQAARTEVLETLGGLAGVLGGNPVDAVADYLLFTAIGAVITPEFARCFASGDGLITVNGKATVIGPFPDNAPPYLAYALFDESGDKYKFELQPPLPTAQLESLVLGTDGAAALLDLEAAKVPGRDEPVGPFPQLWTDDRVFDNADFLRRRLSLLARDAARPDWEGKELRVDPGLLGDDATLIVIRRPPKGA
jgi:hypothetical protein